METISSTVHVARKQHTCNFCNQKIEPGQRYNRQFNKYDDVYVWKSHQHCSELASELRMYDECDEGVTHDDFVEFVNDYFDKFIVAMKGYLAPPPFEQRLKDVLEKFNLIE